MRTPEANGKRLFVERGKIQVDPTLPPRPDIWAWVKEKFTKLFE